MRILVLGLVAITLLAGCGANPTVGIQAKGIATASAQSKSTTASNIVSGKILLVDRGSEGHANLHLRTDHKQAIRVEKYTRIYDYSQTLTGNRLFFPDIYPYANLVDEQLVRGQLVTIQVEKYTDPTNSAVSWRAKSITIASERRAPSSMVSGKILLVDRGSEGHSNLHFRTDYKQAVRVEKATEIVDYTHQLSGNSSAFPEVYPYSNLVDKELIQGQQVTIQVQKFTDPTNAAVSWRATSITIR